MPTSRSSSSTGPDLGPTTNVLSSARCRSYVDEFKQRLRKHKASPSVREFVRTVRDSRLWAPVGQ